MGDREERNRREWGEVNYTRKEDIIDNVTVYDPDLEDELYGDESIAVFNGRIPQFDKIFEAIDRNGCDLVEFKKMEAEAGILKKDGNSSIADAASNNDPGGGTDNPGLYV